ncbi:Adenylate kinase [Cytophaga hutchinsonii ATCC 33406]|uniref:Adenylate kinase n=2 Tax=Cytophaga hutchinsonii TaxID=985 RepID=A0A6N4SM88_CYTH3|nr:Adenylate kinase [Cytophaga hutchinsonii ATCC 33406]
MFLQIKLSPLMLNIVLFGPPGAGKGTQSEKLIAKYKLAHLSTGDIFRDHISRKTELGVKVKEYIDNGLLVPDEVTVGILKAAIESNAGATGFIFDGFPRTVHQAEVLDNMLATLQTKIHAVVALDVNEEELKKRIEIRKQTSGRADDDAEKVLKRIDEYFNKTVHVLPYYEAQGKAVKVQGIGEIETIFTEICNAVDAAK